MSRSGIQDISGSFNPGDSAYFQDISDNLTLRWSTVSDRAGCTLLSCLAPGLSEGKENEFALRYFEPYTSDTFYAGSSTNWAVCVDKAPLLDAPEVSPGIANSLEESPYVASLRKEAADAPERVVALVYFLPAEFTFERGSSQVPVAKAQIVACSATYRQGKCGPNIMKGLFKMVHSRAQQTGCAFTITSGIPAYYGKHDYEYALNLGRGLITHTSSIATPGKTIPAESPYTMRVATLNDIPILESLIISSRKTAEIFSGVSSDALRNQLQWMLGQRSPPFDGNSLIYEYGQFFLLEKESKTVAAVGLSKKPNPRVPAPAISIHPLLWDGEEDAPVVVTALVQHLISAVNDILLKEGGSVELANIVWVVSDGHPLRRWLLAHELAIATPESSLYDSNGNWWINIPSPNLFLASIIPALNERLARATHIFGKHYTSELRISQYSTSVEGVIVRISNSVVTSVHGYDISSDDLETGAFGNGGPNVVLPHGALIQLLMGYKTWSQLKDFHPDVAAIPALVPLLEVLFPKLTLGSSLYF